jgi:hypothetical protein
MTKTAAKIADIYLDYYNNFLTVERFAEYYGVSVECAKHLIEAGKLAQEERASFFKETGILITA